MKIESSLLSVGIDIGTTTTHMVVCKLVAANTTYGFNVPRLEIQNRTIVYESPIFLTPLVDGLIDEKEVYKLIKEQYKCAGVKPADIQCGAIIITGESARTRNAEEVVKALSGLAGDFVAASAGPHLESVLAAKGAGVDEYSKRKSYCVTNIDIGGGTTNVATYANGDLLNSWCFNIGGRFLQFDSENRVTNISSAGKYLCDYARVTVSKGTKLSDSSKQIIAASTAQLLIDLVVNSECCKSHQELFLTECPTIETGNQEYWFSGGVASLMDGKYIGNSCFSDMGKHLADCLNQEVDKRELNCRIVNSPIRATVIGAGSHTVQLSGHTVFAPPDSLPIKDIPIFKCPKLSIESDNYSLEHYMKSLSDYLSIAVKEYSGKPIALVLPNIDLSSYIRINKLSKLLSGTFDKLPLGEPVVIIVESDSALALGQQLKLNSSHRKYVVLDGIKIEVGDFIEIGKPVSSGLTLPVTIKTLLFP